MLEYILKAEQVMSNPCHLYALLLNDNVQKLIYLCNIILQFCFCIYKQLLIIDLNVFMLSLVS